jgi:hypothetical protein
MAVASPYAVFRAVDLGWPLAMPALTSTPATESNRGLRRRTAPQWNTLIQGELFPA